MVRDGRREVPCEEVGGRIRIRDSERVWRVQAAENPLALRSEA